MCVAHVCLAPRDVLDDAGVSHDDSAHARCQDIVKPNPVDVRGLEGHLADIQGYEPVLEFLEALGGVVKLSPRDRGPILINDVGDEHVLVDVDPTIMPLFLNLIRCDDG